jgi:formate dehydrogenase beta subunit
MPANEVEIVAAEHEGIKFQFLAAPTRVIDDGRQCQGAWNTSRWSWVNPMPADDGDRCPSKDRRPVLDVDMVISAISQQPDLDFLEKEPDRENIAITRWNTFDNDPENLAVQPAVPVHRR